MWLTCYRVHDTRQVPAGEKGSAVRNRLLDSREGGDFVTVKTDDSFVTHVSGWAPAPVTADKGWRKMDIRFILNRDASGHGSVCVFRTVFEPGAAHEIHTHPAADEF